MPETTVGTPPAVVPADRLTLGVTDVRDGTRAAAAPGCIAAFCGGGLYGEMFCMAEK